jgi:hypothetical protein
MPNTPNIQLDVRNFASNQPGWYNVQSSSNQPYSYSYTGGDDGVGGLVQTVGQGRDTSVIRSARASSPMTTSTSSRGAAAATGRERSSMRIHKSRPPNIQSWSPTPVTAIARSFAILVSPTSRSDDFSAARP